MHYWRGRETERIYIYSNDDNCIYMDCHAVLATHKIDSYIILYT